MKKSVQKYSIGKKQELTNLDELNMNKFTSRNGSDRQRIFNGALMASYDLK